jgi:hypothetical protein
MKEEKEQEEQYGLLDSGATRCVREAKDQEEFHSLIPIKVKVPFESKVESQLFMTRQGTIVGPKGTETIVSMNELAKIGWKVIWIGDKVDITKGRTKLPVTIKGNTPVLPLKMCLELIEEIEKERMITKDQKKMTLKEVWPQRKYEITWMIQHQIEGAMELLNLIVCRRRKEIELEAKEKSEEEKTEIIKTKEVNDQQENEEKRNMVEIKVIENP